MISPIEEIIEDAREGRPVVIVDAEDRENEGDVIIPAQFATPTQINFMAKHARGLICVSMTEERAKTLRLSPMTAHNGPRHSTALSVSIEAREWVPTGLSVHDPAHTFAVAAAPETTADDIGHTGRILTPILPSRLRSSVVRNK